MRQDELQDAREESRFGCRPPDILGGDAGDRKEARQQLGLARADVPDVESAADLEFSYSDQGVALHAVERSLVIDGSTYAVWFQSHEDEWLGAEEIRDGVLASFRAA